MYCLSVCMQETMFITTAAAAAAVATATIVRAVTDIAGVIMT